MKSINFYLLLLVILVISCGQDSTLYKLQQIKSIGNSEPNKAMIMLDSLEFDVRGKDEYTKAKFDLLRIRLNDKADVIPTSDIAIKSLLAFFEEHGSTIEKQEVNYYAGSVYRDLQDTPKALEYFFRSLDYASLNEKFDTVMLRNTYSNLQYLHYNVQNYEEALLMAKKELAITMQLGDNIVLPCMHIGSSYLALDSIEKAEAAFDSVFIQIKEIGTFQEYQDVLSFLLCNYSELGKQSKANKVFPYIKEIPIDDCDLFQCLSFAKYYASSDQNSLARFYCEHLLENGDITYAYDASKLLYKISRSIGDDQQSCEYADLYMQLSDSIDFGKRQILAANVNNEYKYHLDAKKEQKLKQDKERYRNSMFVILCLAGFGICITYILSIKRRNRHLKRSIQLSLELKRVSQQEGTLREEIKTKEDELELSRHDLEETRLELDNVRLELQRVNKDLSEYGEALKAKEQLLADKMEQNKTFIKLLHKSELEGKAEDVIHAIRQSSTGKKEMTDAEWKQLYQAVDELYPSFKDRLLKELGSFTEQQMQVCYLMRAGLSKTQIQNMVRLSRVTIWRWVKKFDWVLTPDNDV